MVAFKSCLLLLVDDVHGLCREPSRATHGLLTGIFSKWIHTKFYFCRDNVCTLPTCPLPLWVQRPLGAGEGELKTQKLGVVSFVHKTATIFIFLSVAKCGSICRAQTCAHSGVELSRSAKAFLQGGPKSSKKFRIFHHFETLHPSISETIKNRGI